MLPAQVYAHCIDIRKYSLEIFDLAIWNPRIQDLIIAIDKIFLNNAKGNVKDKKLYDYPRQKKFAEECTDNIKRVLLSHCKELIPSQMSVLVNPTGEVSINQFMDIGKLDSLQLGRDIRILSNGLGRKQGFGVLGPSSEL